ncbi:Bacitracin synthetase 3 (BA3) [Brevibacillus laterosporus]|nr:Bacitracin synthetase 3 (BA3) [Brevibacillus laterosporus]
MASVYERETYPLTHPQKRIWFTEEFFPNTSISNIGGLINVQANQLDYELLEQAIQAFIQLNESIRLRIVLEEEYNEPQQYIAPYVKTSLPFYDFSGAVNTNNLYAWAQHQIETPLPLIDQDLFEIATIKVSEQQGYIFLKIHHIIADGTAYIQSVNQIMTLYTELVGGVDVLEATKVSIPASYTEYIQGELEYERSDRFAKDRAFWHEEFATRSEFMGLKMQDTSSVSTRGNRKRFIVPQELRKQAQTFCKEHNISFFTLFISVFHTYLSRMTGQTDITIGTNCYNRTQRKEKDMIGMLVSTMPFRVQGNADQNVLSFIRSVAKKQTKLFRHQKYPYNKLVQEIRENHSDVNGLFSIYAGYQVLGFEQREGVRYIMEQLFTGHLTEEISLYIQEHPDKDILTIDIDYLCELYTEEELSVMTNHLLHLMKDAITNPDKRVADLQMITETEKEKLLMIFNPTPIPYPESQTVHQLFEEQAAKHPARSAVMFNEEQLTYSKLNEKANQLSRVLLKKGIGVEHLVAIMADRSLEMVIAVLAVLKAGGAYIPIDPTYPVERIRYMLEDSQVQVLLSQMHLMDTVMSDEGLAWTGSIIDLMDGHLYQGDASNLDLSVKPNDLAYLIYTSGTTGKPKGVMVEHRNYVNVSYAWRQAYKLDTFEIKLLQMASFSFDVFAGDLSRALFNGGQLIICPDDVRLDPPALYELIMQHRVNIFEATPALVLPLIQYIYRNGLDISQMELLILGSDTCVVEGFRKLVDYFGDSMRIINSYGVTEATIDTSFFEGTADNLEYVGIIPIGKPLCNMTMYILDHHLQPQPIGVPGELYIGGAGVARGYLNNPELTIEKFINNPFIPDGKIYRTGDKACWMGDGNIQFLGRADQQVKVRGFRIEPGEIETGILVQPDIQEAVVLAQEDSQGVKYLCAYFVATREVKISELRDFLASELPSYLIPSHFVQLEKMPLTPNGKVDKRALPKPDISQIIGNKYVKPRNEAEAKLTRVWQDVLDIERIGIHDNFFEIGGHSLKANVLVSQIHKLLGVRLSLRYVFQYPTIAEMIPFLELSLKEVAVTLIEKETGLGVIQPVEKSDYYPLSAAQRRVLIMSQLEKVSISYNMPHVWKIDGHLNDERLEASLLALINRHESLRTRFVWMDGDPVQQIHETVDFCMVHRYASPEELNSIVDLFTQPFHLGQGPLFRAELVTYAKDKHLFMIDMHHIISDGVSIATLCDELSNLYAGADLPQLRIQYKDFAVWQQEFYRTEMMKAQESYWLQHLSGEVPVLQLSTDFLRPAEQSFQGDTVFFVTDAELSRNLHELTAHTGTTMYMILLAAFQVLLAKYSDQDDILVGTVSAGRSHNDLQSMVGMFLNTLVIRSYPVGEKTFATFLAEVKETSLHAFENQDYPFEELVKKLGVQRDLSRNPFFDVLFVMQNAETRSDLILGEALISSYPAGFDAAKFDLTFQVTEGGESLSFALNYCTKLFKRETIERMSTHFTQLIRAIVKNPHIHLADIDMLTDEEKEELLVAYNPTPTSYPADKTIQQLFEEQAALIPDHVAVRFENHQLTYQELNERANQLARHLQTHGVTTESIVGIMVKRSLEMIIGILGVLKAGGAYLPLDPDYPQERIMYMLEDSGSKVLLTQTAFLQEEIPLLFRGDIILIDGEDICQQESSNLVECTTSDSLAYLIYTSGSTGKPKAVLIEHKAVHNFMLGMLDLIPFSNQSVILSLTSMSFDIFVLETLLPLTTGAEVIIATEEQQVSPSQITHLLRKHRVNLLQMTPSRMNMVINQTDGAMGLSDLEAILIGGEAFPEQLLTRLQQVTSARLFNMYGPTETTVWSSIHELTHATAVSIGRPIRNTKFYILNENQQIQPIGVAGELYIGGDGVARGYWNRADLTEERFILNPFVEGERLYRTGDRAMRLADGNVKHLGRTDDQVKIRGYRVELSEIEVMLLRHEAIHMAAITVQEETGQEKSLVAYYVSQEVISAAELRLLLMQTLPSYMIPAYFVHMEFFPLTPNGKINRNALPKSKQDPLHYDYAIPTNEMEVKLVVIWQELLGIEKVGVNQNFFELGGHSLLGIEMVERAKIVLQTEVALMDIFKFPTISTLSKHLGNNSVQSLEHSQVRADTRKESMRRMRQTRKHR